MHKKKFWRLKKSNPIMQFIISRELGVSPILAQLLLNRGLTTTGQIRRFFTSDLSDLHDPSLLKDMDVAVGRILQAIKEKEKILIYGDYDVDGVTATTVLVRGLRKLTKAVDYYIPHRLEEGYGLHPEAVKKAFLQGYNLIITVDCGISGIEAAAWAGQNGGPDLIITDHHEPPPELPSALAVIDPKRADCSYPFKELAGVGVALKLLQAVYSSFTGENYDWKEYLDLVCLGTIADVVPLLGENRILVKYGLPYLSKTAKPGLRALIDVTGLKGELNTGNVGFALAPRINAAGRLGACESAVELLLTEDEGLARQLAVKLNEGNQERKSVEDEVLAAVIEILEKEPDLLEDKVLVLASAAWHPGVIGLVASRLVERYYRPVLLIALEEVEGKGSARSIPGFNMYEALHYCRENLLGYGGHVQAAGFSLEVKKVEDLRRAINEYAAKTLSEEQLTPVIELDGIFPVEQINEQLVAEIDQLAPFGQANPSPLLCCPEAEVINYRGVGKDGAHLKMLFKSGTRQIDGIGFNMAAYSEILATSEKVNLAFVPEINEWQGQRNVQLRVKDLKTEQVSPLPELNKNSDLHKNSYLLFQPEFILNKLFEYKSLNNEIFLPGVNERPPIVNHNECKFLPPHTVVVDHRNSPERLNTLISLELSKLTLILVGCGYQAIELAQYLWRERPDLRDAVAYCYLAMNKQESFDVLKALDDQKIRVLITTPESAYHLKLPDLTQVLLYDLPYGTMQWRLLGSILSQTGIPKKLHLLFSEMNLAINKHKLMAIIPEREVLAALYTQFRQESAALKSNIVEINVIQAVNKLNTNRKTRFSIFAVQLGLNVFRELGLLKFQRQGIKYQLTLFPTPKKKLNLGESATFNWCESIRQEFIGFSPLLLSLPPAELFKIRFEEGAYGFKKDN